MLLKSKCQAQSLTKYKFWEDCLSDMYCKISYVFGGKKLSEDVWFLSDITMKPPSFCPYQRFWDILCVNMWMMVFIWTKINTYMCLLIFPPLILHKSMKQNFPESSNWPVHENMLRLPHMHQRVWIQLCPADGDTVQKSENTIREIRIIKGLVLQLF